MQTITKVGITRRTYPDIAKRLVKNADLPVSVDKLVQTHDFYLRGMFPIISRTPLRISFRPTLPNDENKPYTCLVETDLIDKVVMVTISYPEGLDEPTERKIKAVGLGIAIGMGPPDVWEDGFYKRFDLSDPSMASVDGIRLSCRIFALKLILPVKLPRKIRHPEKYQEKYGVTLNSVLTKSRIDNL